MEPEELLKQMETMYLEWYNDFLTTEAFADFYAIDPGVAYIILRAGKEYNQYLNTLNNGTKK